MAKEFSKKFYNSKNWKKTREYIFGKNHGLCEECGKPGEEVHHKTFLTPFNIDDPEVTLAEDNLVLLCRDCHFNKHERRFKKKAKNNTATNNGLYFTENGELVSTNVYIVYGSPGSGKSTYVEERRESGDLVVDLDLLKQAISLENKTNALDNLLPIALELRELLYKIIENREINCKNVWIISSLPRKDERETLKDRLKAKLIFIDTNANECLRRAMNDDTRENKALQKEIISNWFYSYQP